VAAQRPEGDGNLEMTGQLQTHVVPNVYFNGVLVRLSLSDINMVLMTDGLPSCELHMSFTTAKTLAEKLSDIVTEFERRTGHGIMTMGEVAEGLKEPEQE